MIFGLMGVKVLKFFVIVYGRFFFFCFCLEVVGGYVEYYSVVYDVVYCFFSWNVFCVFFDYYCQFDFVVNFFVYFGKDYWVFWVNKGVWWFEEEYWFFWDVVFYFFCVFCVVFG